MNNIFLQYTFPALASCFALYLLSLAIINFIAISKYIIEKVRDITMSKSSIKKLREQFEKDCGFDRKHKHTDIYKSEWKKWYSEWKRGLK